jgi:hypothetical protein
MSVITELLSGATGGIFSGIGTLLKDARVAITGVDPAKAAELQQIVSQLELETQKAQSAMIVAEASSSDPWTSRSRPAFLWQFYFMLTAIGVLAPFVGVFYPQQMLTFFTNVKLGLAAIPDSLYTLFGAGYLGYTGARSFDKVKGTSK